MMTSKKCNAQGLWHKKGCCWIKSAQLRNKTKPQIINLLSADVRESSEGLPHNQRQQLPFLA
jgi:hypothetical protein